MNKRYTIFEPKRTQVEGHPFTFWVTVTRDLSLDKYHIECCVNPHTVLRHLSAYDTLLYIRAFTDIHAAIGHKLFLESLSIQSLERMVRCGNPDEEDLRMEVEALLKADGQKFNMAIF